MVSFDAGVNLSCATEDFGNKRQRQKHRISRYFITGIHLVSLKISNINEYSISGQPALS
jgi:hypothetical protein